MTNLSVEEWAALTYIQDHTRRNELAPRHNDIRQGCSFASKEQTRQVVSSLLDKGLVDCRYRRATLRVYLVPGAVVGVEP